MYYDIFYPKRPFVLANDSGFYFDEINKDLKDTLEYPDYDYLLKNINELKNSNKAIILYSTQKKEIELLSIYFPVAKAPILMDYITNKFIINLTKYNENEILELAEKEKRYEWLSVFVYGRLHKQLNLNPSYAMKTESLINIWKYYDLKNIDLPNTKDYINSREEFEPIIFLELATAELLGKETEESKAIKQLLKYKSGEEIPMAELNLTDKFREDLTKAALIYLNGKGDIVRV